MKEIEEGALQDRRKAQAKKRQSIDLLRRKQAQQRMAAGRAAREKEKTDIQARRGLRAAQASKHAQKNWRQEEAEIDEKDLSYKERQDMSSSQFALPGKGSGPEGKQGGSYPIPDESHARNALARVSQHGSESEKKKVRSAVSKKFPGIKIGEDVKALPTSAETDAAFKTWEKRKKKKIKRQKLAKAWRQHDDAMKKMDRERQYRKEDHDCNETHPGMTHKEWVEDQKIESTYSERISSDVPAGNASGAKGSKKKELFKARKFRNITPGQVRDFERLSSARMFQAYEQKADEDAPATNTAGVAIRPTILFKTRRKIDGRSKDYREAVKRTQARRDAQVARDTEQKLNMFGVQSNPFKEEIEMDNNNKYLKTKVGSIEEAVLKSLTTEKPVNPNDARPTLHLPEKKYLSIKEGSLENAVTDVMTEKHKPGHGYKLPRQLKDPKKEKMVGTPSGTKVVDKNDPRYAKHKEHESVKYESGEKQWPVGSKGGKDYDKDGDIDSKDYLTARDRAIKRTKDRIKNRLQPESAGARGERDIGSQAYTDYVKNLTPGEGDSAVTNKDAQSSAKSSQVANKEKKIRSTRIDDEYQVNELDQKEMPTIKIPKKLKIKSLYPPNKPIRKISGAQVENNVPDADYDHATALYKDQWKDRKIADYDKEHDKEKRAKEMRADAGEDRKRMYAMTQDKWKHAKYATGEEEGKKSETGNTPDPKDAYKEEVSPLVAATVNELKKTTYGSYIQKSADSSADAAMALQRTADKNQTRGDVDKHVGKMMKRRAGREAAVRQLTKNEYEPQGTSMIDAAATAIGRLERESFSGTPNMTHDPKFGQSIATNPLGDAEKVRKLPKGATTKALQKKQVKTSPPGSTSEEVEDIEEVTFGISVNKAMAGTTVPPKQKKGFRGVGKPPAGWITRKAGTKPGEMTTAEYDPTLGDLSQLSKTLKKLHNEYVAEEVVEITSIDDLAGLDHHDFGFETRADMVEFALHQIEDMGRSVKKPAVSQSEIDAFLAKGGKIKKIKSKGIPKYAKAAHQKMGPASAHRMYKPGSGKSEEVE